MLSNINTIITLRDSLAAFLTLDKYKYPKTLLSQFYPVKFDLNFNRTALIIDRNVLDSNAYKYQVMRAATCVEINREMHKIQTLDMTPGELEESLFKLFTLLDYYNKIGNNQ